MRLDRNHGNPELAAQPVRVNPQALVLGHIHHRQRNDDRQAQLENLADQIEIPLQVVRRDHAEHDVGSRHVREPAEQDIDGHHLVGRPGRQAVGARQVDQNPAPPLVDHFPDRLFDGHPGVVANPLLNSGQGPEQGGFAGVRVSDQGNRAGAAIGGGRHRWNRRRKTDWLATRPGRSSRSGRDSTHADHHMRAVIHAESKPLAVEANDARAARADHLHLGSVV